MSHDIDDLLEVIRQLELRVIEIERTLDEKVRELNHDDAYYWAH